MQRVVYVTDFFFTVPATTDTYTLSLHDALPISYSPYDVNPIFVARCCREGRPPAGGLLVGVCPSAGKKRSEEHTSELQSHSDLVCRLLLEKKKTRSGERRRVQCRLRRRCVRRDT